jgi:hypothetical protein
MKNINRLAIALSVALMGTGVIATQAMAQDKAKPAMAQDKAKPTQKDERDRKILVDNEKVLVTENRYKPGAASGMAVRGARVVRAMSDGTLERTYPDGKKETITWKKDQVRYSPKETFDQKNTGKADLLLYSVTIK